MAFLSPTLFILLPGVCPFAATFGPKFFVTFRMARLILVDGGRALVIYWKPSYNAEEHLESVEICVEGCKIGRNFAGELTSDWSIGRVTVEKVLLCCRY